MSSQATAPEELLPETILEPTRGWAALRLSDVWNYRELVYFLTWRDIKVRYKQTVMGALWAVIQPLVTMLVFTVLFGQVAKVPSNDLPYPVFSFAALVPWYFFANGLTFASNSLVVGSNLLKRIYFPRLVMPLASVMSWFLDFAISFVVLLVIMAGYGIRPTANFFALPACVLLLLASALGVSFWLAALNVRFRDVRYTVPFGVQLWLLATPIGYPISIVEEPWRTLAALNPMAGVVVAFRWTLLGGDAPPVEFLSISVSVALLLFVSGAYFFRREERLFADIV